MGTASEGIFVGADDKDNKHLGSQGLYEPAGVEEFFTRVKDAQHHEEREEIKERTDRANGQHELADKAYVPLPGTDQVFLINVV